ncbi:MAG: tetratricopeptide repeat protein, partial [Ignavibacteria bacterium]
INNGEHDAKNYFDLGYEYQKNNNMEEAIENYEKALKINPKIKFANYNLGIIYNEKEDFNEKEVFEKTIEYFNKEIKNYPDYLNSYYNLALIYEKKERYQDAIDIYEEITKKDKAFATDFFNLAHAYQKVDKPIEAIKNYTAAIEKDKKYLAAYVNRALIHEQQGNLEKAIEDCSSAIEIDPAYDLAYYNRAVFDYKLTKQADATKDYKLTKEADAIKDYKKTIDCNPYYENAYNNLSFIFSESEQSDEAINYFSELLKKNPENDLAFSNLTLFFSKSRKFDDAIGFYTELINKNPLIKNLGDFYHERGWYFNKKEKFEDAISDYTKALEKNANYSYVYNNRAVSYEGLKDYTKALEDYKIIIEKVDPEYAIAYYNIACLKLKLNKLDDKLDEVNSYFSDALKYKNKFTSPIDQAWQAIANAYLGNDDEAINLLKNAEKFSDEPELSYYISDAYAILFKKTSNVEFRDKSLKYLKSAIEKEETNIKKICDEIDFDELRKNPEFIAQFGECPK